MPRRKFISAPPVAEQLPESRIGNSEASSSRNRPPPSSAYRLPRQSVVVLRPYSRRIRTAVFDTLHRAGADMEAATIIEAGVGDTQIIARLAGLTPDALLVPFHAHRDQQGTLLNGLQLANRIHSECPHLLELPILMPISAMGMSSAGLMLSRAESAGGLPETLTARILYLTEEDLKDPATVGRVGAHLRSGKR